jgi:hypothetical protein
MSEQEVENTNTETGTAPVENQVQEAAKEPEFTPIELEAMNEGWVPKEHFKGDPKQWRPAEQWLDRGNFFRTISQLRDELKTTKAQVAEAFKQGEKIATAQYNERLQELKAIRRKALQEGDLDTADKIEDQIEEHRENKNKAQPVKATIDTPPEFYQFVQRNPWYQTDAIMQATANAVGAQFVQANPRAQPADLYNYVETMMKQRFPDLYGGKVLREKVAPSTETSSGNRAQTTQANTFKKYKDGMNEMELGIMKTMIRAHPKRFPNEEAYLKEYAKAVDAESKRYGRG